MTVRGSISEERKVEVLLEEYRVLYTLALFRLSALDRRVPLAVGALGAFLVAVAALPWTAQIVVLMVVPISLIWVVRTTISHARSFEDCLRRIEHIEQRTNAIAGEELLLFQSRHPSRGRTTGGRSGGETVAAVMLASGLTLAATGWLADLAFKDLAITPFLGYLAAIGAYLCWMYAMYRQYRYTPNPISRKGSLGEGDEHQGSKGRHSQIMGCAATGRSEALQRALSRVLRLAGRIPP